MFLDKTREFYKRKEMDMRKQLAFCATKEAGKVVFQ